jgi:hypothetical protein
MKIPDAVSGLCNVSCNTTTYVSIYLNHWHSFQNARWYRILINLIQLPNSIHVWLFNRHWITREIHDFIAADNKSTAARHQWPGLRGMKDAFTLKRDEYFLNGLIEHYEHGRPHGILIHPSATFHKTMPSCSLVRTLSWPRVSLLNRWI